MIKNERQYRVTASQAAKFQDALAQIDQPDATQEIDPAIAQAHRDAVAGELAQLKAQIAEYDALRDTRPSRIPIGSLAELPELLVKARIAIGWSQSDLGARLGLAEQQIQRYEATDYSSASLRRLLEIADALGVRIEGEAALRPMDLSIRQLLQHLSSAGLDRRFVLERLLPHHMADQLGRADIDEGPILGTLLSTLTRVFGWSTSDLIHRSDLAVPSGPLVAASLKRPKVASEPALLAYAAYGQYLAQLVALCTPNLERSDIHPDWEWVARHVDKMAGRNAYERIVRFAWSVGIAVLPLEGSGGFHAATWRRSGLNIVVLKQSNKSPAHWAFDLLHELRHCAGTPSTEELTRIDSDEAESQDPDFEWECHLFAGNVLLRGSAELLAEDAVASAGGRVERLKGVLPAIAQRHSVPADAAANYMAHRLAFQGINWWGAASDLQEQDDPWAFARDMLLAHLDTSVLSKLDRSVLLLALSRNGIA